MITFTEKHPDQILGQLACFDRLIIQGTFPDICHPQAITNFFFTYGIRIFDFKNWAAPLRDMINNNAKSISEKYNIEIEFIRKKNFRKEERIKEILTKRGYHPGLVHIFSAMESCTAFKPWHDKSTHKTFLKYDSGRCLHYYFYFVDKNIGLCYLRIPTWVPFRLQFYFNGHNWLARQLDKSNIGYKQVENAFVSIDNFESAQFIADSFSVKELHKVLNSYAAKLCPVMSLFKSGIHWSVMQAEYATDIIFKNRNSLAPIYEELVRTLSHAIKPDNLCMFLGKKLSPLFEGELNEQFQTRIQGHSIRYYMAKNGIKMYDKFGMILRIETFSNDISFFKHLRKVEHRDGSCSNKIANMRKTIFSLPDLAKVMFACNRRYIEFLSCVEDPTSGIKKVNKISATVRKNGRSFRGFNLFNSDDEIVFRTIAQGEAQCFGFRNANLRTALGKTTGQISGILRRLRTHGLIKKAPMSYKYYLTSFGRQVVSTSLKLKEMFIIPAMRGSIQFA